jgi:ribosomal protein S17E
MGFMVGKSSAKPSLKLHLLWLGMQPLYQDVKICDLGPVHLGRSLISRLARKLFDKFTSEISPCYENNMKSYIDNFLSCQQLFNSIDVQCYVTAGNFTR